MNINVGDEIEFRDDNDMLQCGRVRMAVTPSWDEPRYEVRSHSGLYNVKAAQVERVIKKVVAVPAIEWPKFRRENKKAPTQ